MLHKLAQLTCKRLPPHATHADGSCQLPAVSSHLCLHMPRMLMAAASCLISSVPPHATHTDGSCQLSQTAPAPGSQATLTISSRLLLAATVRRETSRAEDGMRNMHGIFTAQTQQTCCMYPQKNASLRSCNRSRHPPAHTHHHHHHVTQSSHSINAIGPAPTRTYSEMCMLMLYKVA
jgi:hypothetical protein